MINNILYNNDLDKSNNIPKTLKLIFEFTFIS